MCLVKENYLEFTFVCYSNVVTFSCIISIEMMCVLCFVKVSICFYNDHPDTLEPMLTVRTAMHTGIRQLIALADSLYRSSLDE